MHPRWPEVSSLSAVAALAFALSGCGGGGTVSKDVPNGDDNGISLLDNWQRFKDGDPTLRMTSAQVSEAWRSAARQSTHRVILAGPVGVGNDPGSITPAETFPAFPADVDTCSPGDCDFDPPPDSTWAFAPVLEHDGVPVAEFKVRFSRTETLEPERETDDRETFFVTTRAGYRRRARRGRFGWPPAGCNPDWPWTGDSLRFGSRLRRTFGCGSSRRLSA